MSNTYYTFEERIRSLEKQYQKFIDLKNEYSGPISDAYSSLAANILTTISELKIVFEVYKTEYSE